MSKTSISWNRAHPERMKEVGKHYRARIRDKVFSVYGQFCQCCGESDKRFLTLDHIKNDGANHRRSLSKTSSRGWGSGANLYVWLKNNSFPKGFQTLCYNCNCGRARNSGVCPHEESVRKTVNA